MFGILSDLYDECRTRAADLTAPDRIEPFADHFYLRFNIVNLTDTMAQLLQMLNRNGIEIEKIHQTAVAVSRETSDTAGYAIILITSRTTRDNLERALGQIAGQVKLAGLKACFRYIRQA